jgi:hypothetical protein
VTIGIGEPLPDLVVETAAGVSFPLRALRGRPWGVVCVRYYG